MSEDDTLQETLLLPSPGRMLHEARIARKIGLEQVADVLRLHVSVIEALEADDAANLPAPAFVRGYLRAYAKMMEVPADQVIDAYNQLNGDDEPDIRIRKGVKAQANSLDPRMRLATYVIAAVLIVLLALWWYTERDAAAPDSPAAEEEAAAGSLYEPSASEPGGKPGAPAAPGPVTARTPVVQETSVPEAVSPELDAETTPGTGRVAAASGDTVEKEPVTKATEAEKALPESRAEAPDAAAEEMAQAPPAAPEGSQLRLVLKGDSWVEIHDAEGERLIYDLLRGGKTVDVYGREPFRVFLGNAAGVEVYLNGERFDHSAYDRGNLARFELGQP